MRHALVLRALRLPTVAALCICVALVVMTAYSQFSTNNRQDIRNALPSPQSSADDQLIVDDQPTGEDLGSLPRAATPSRSVENSATNDHPILVAAGEPIVRASANGHSRTLDFQSLIEPSASASTRHAAETLWQRQFGRLPPATRYVAKWQLDGPIADSIDHAGTDDVALSVPHQDVADHGTDARESANPELERNDTPIRVTNAPTNRYFVAFVVNNQVYQLEPGEVLSLDLSTATLRFDRGGGLGAITQQLVSGDYDFQLAPGGWELLPQTH